MQNDDDDSQKELRRRWIRACRVHQRAIAAAARGDSLMLPAIDFDPFVGLRCGARSKRTGRPCPHTGLFANGRCRWHGGLSTGPKTDEGKARSALNGGRRPMRVTRDNAVTGGRHSKDRAMDPSAPDLPEPPEPHEPTEGPLSNAKPSSEVAPLAIRLQAHLKAAPHWGVSAHVLAQRTRCSEDEVRVALARLERRGLVHARVRAGAADPAVLWCAGPRRRSHDGEAGGAKR